MLNIQNNRIEWAWLPCKRIDLLADDNMITVNNCKSMRIHVIIFLFICIISCAKKSTMNNKTVVLLKSYFPRIEDSFGIYRASFHSHSVKLELFVNMNFKMSASYNFGFEKEISGSYQIIDDILVLKSDSAFTYNIFENPKMITKSDSLEWRDLHLNLVSNVYFFKKYKQNTYLVAPGHCQLIHIDDFIENYDEPFVKVKNGKKYGDFVLVKSSQ